MSQLSLTIGRAQFRALRFALLHAAAGNAGLVHVDGVAMPYISCGTGPAALLVHGFGGDKETWLLMASTLTRRRRVIMMDLPGFGAADPVPANRASAQAQARALVGFADQLGYHRFDLVGNSMGGGIILRVCQDYPGRVRSLALIGSVGPEAELSECRRLLDAGDNPLIPRSLDDGERFFSLIMERRPTLPTSLQRYMMSRSIDRRDRHATMWQGWENAPTSERYPADVSELAVPALVIHGTCDRVVDPSVGAALAAQLPHAELVSLACVGHVPQVEVPRRTARLLNDFWAQRART